MLGASSDRLTGWSDETGAPAARWRDGRWRSRGRPPAMRIVAIAASAPRRRSPAAAFIAGLADRERAVHRRAFRAGLRRSVSRWSRRLGGAARAAGDRGVVALAVIGGVGWCARSAAGSARTLAGSIRWRPSVDVGRRVLPGLPRRSARSALGTDGSMMPARCGGETARGGVGEPTFEADRDGSAGGIRDVAGRSTTAPIPTTGASASATCGHRGRRRTRPRRATQRPRSCPCCVLKPWTHARHGSAGRPIMSRRGDGPS